MNNRIPRINFRVSLLYLTVFTLVMVAGYAGNLIASAHAAASCGGSIRAGRPISGQIARANSSCIYSFTGKRGETIAVRMSEISRSLDPSVNILFRNRSLKRENNSSRSNSDSVVASFKLPTSGTFSIVASASNSTTGAFKLAVSKCSSLRAGRTTGASLVSGQIACYTLSGRSGKVVTMTPIRGKVDRRFQPRLELYDSRGYLAAGSKLTKGRAMAALPATGTYTVIARSYDDQSRGSFSIGGNW